MFRSPTEVFGNLRSFLSILSHHFETSREEEVLHHLPRDIRPGLRAEDGFHGLMVQRRELRGLVMT
jgi:hypothetical protein